jgi:hypothetical protein
VQDFRYDVYGASDYLMPVVKYHFVKTDNLKLRFARATKKDLAEYPTTRKFLSFFKTELAVYYDLPVQV